MKLYSIRDNATEAHMRPWPAQTDGQALRMIVDALMDPKEDIAKHPEDYSLWCHGTFNESTGEIDVENKCLARCVDLISGGDGNATAE